MTAWCNLVQTWDCERIDTAEVQEESDCFEMEPTNELKVGNNVQLYSMVRSVAKGEQSMWYAQVSVAHENRLYFSCILD